MAFFEELGKTLTDTGKEVATKAKALTEAIQIKTQLSAEKAKMDGAFTEIGRYCYENHQQPEHEELSKSYETVRSCRQRIADLEAELCQVEGSRICAECGAKVPKDSAFCGKCGAAMSAPIIVPEGSVVQAEDESGAACGDVCEEAAQEEPEDGGEEKKAGISQDGEEAFVNPEE